MYNVRIIEYPSGVQCRVYKNPIFSCVAPYGGDDYFFLDDEDDEEVTPEVAQSRKEHSMYVSANRTLNKVYYLARSNLWDWFITLTFDPLKVDSLDYDACTDALKNWIDVSRRLCPGMRYLMVPELHKSGRFHFHGLFACCDALGFVDSGVRSAGQVVYNVGNYHLGFSTATRIQDNGRVTKYISKYISKELCAASKGRKRYWASRNLDKAAVNDYVLDGYAYGRFYQAVSPYVLHAREVQGMYNEVSYFELSEGFGDVEERWKKQEGGALQ